MLSNPTLSLPAWTPQSALHHTPSSKLPSQTEHASSPTPTDGFVHTLAPGYFDLFPLKALPAALSNRGACSMPGQPT